MSARPRVSVCIPTRDQAEYLVAAVASALAQDVDGLEVLVHDDASDDATPAVVRLPPQTLRLTTAGRIACSPR